MPTRIARAAPALVVLAAAAPAWAQGYVVTAESGRIEPRPADAARVDVDSVHAEKSSALAAFPFRFSYYGEPCSTVVVSAFGWVLPGAKHGFADAGDPSAAHGQDASSGAFPYGAGGAGANGVVAPLWAPYRFVNDGSPGAGAVFAWTSGTAPSRRFVVSWEDVAVGDGPRVTVQVQLCEGPGRIVFAYRTATTGAAGARPRTVCGFDSPSDARFTAPPASSTGGLLPSSDFVFDPRTVLFNSPAAVEHGTPVAWQHIRRESLSGENAAKACCYVAKGDGWFFVPDRAARSAESKTGLRADSSVTKRLADEDAREFGGSPGDPHRWVRQVLDGKAILVPADGGPPVRLWLRVIEWFTLDEWGVAGPDHHVWNLRLMLHRVFGDGDPRADVANYSAWRAMASGRLSVVKLFPFGEKDDAGQQYTTNRTEEYVLWCSRFKTGTRGALPARDCPDASWSRFRQKDTDDEMPQHADKGDLRDVADPEYVDGNYSYVIRSDDDASGWVTRGRTPSAALSDETIDDDPGAAAETAHGR
jgi:hypothetical protein